MIDSFLRLVLVALNRTVGARSGRVRAICSYGIDLVDRGASGEFRALIWHRLRRAVGFNGLPSGRLLRGWPAIPIDAKTERLTPEGTVASKPAFVFPSADAPILVSIVIPCYNYGEYLDEAISSARTQSLASKEIIVVDDGSNDEQTLAVLERVAIDGELRLVRQENQGLSSARNRGIAAARGEYICCLDADDMLGPTYLEQAIAVLETDRAVGFAYSWVQFFGDVADVWHAQDFDADAALIGNFTSVAAVFRRDDSQQIGGFSVEMQGGFEDWEFWIRLAGLGRRGRCIRHTLFRHRRHGRTMTHTAKEILPELRERMRRLYPSFYESRALRRRLGRLVSKPGDAVPGLGALSRPNVIAGDERPGLVVVVAGLMNGGAHGMLHDILSRLTSRWRITIVTTADVAHPMEDQFRAVTQEIFHLDGFIEPSHWLAFLSHLVETRRAAAILSSDSIWFLDHVRAVRSAHPRIRILDILHNHVPTSTFRSAIRNSRAIDRHVAVSSTIAEALARSGIPAARIAEIPNGVDAEAMFDPGRLDRTAARRALGVDARQHGGSPRQAGSDRLVLAWIGRMSEEKRPLLFLDVVAAIARECDVSGVMFGDGPLAGDVDAAIRSRGLVASVERRAHTPRAELAQVYAAADLVVLTSRVEGMPLVVLEALAMGCPVAATDVGDVRRMLRHKVNGFLAPADGIDQLIEHVRVFAHDVALQSAMRHEAATSLRNSPYHASRMADAYARLLDS